MICLFFVIVVVANEQPKTQMLVHNRSLSLAGTLEQDGLPLPVDTGTGSRRFSGSMVIMGLMMENSGTSRGRAR